MTNGREWTMVADENATIRRMAASGRTDAEIGKHFGRNRQWARRRRCDLGIAAGYRPALGAMVARLYLRRSLRRASLAA